MESEEFETESVLEAEIADLDEDLDDESDDAQFVEDFDDDSDEAETELDQTPRKPVIAMSALPITGEPRVDDALARLNEIPALPVHEHVEVFEDVQRRLHETLADLSNQ